MKILVTGASGFVGQALCLALVQAGHQLTGVTRRPRTWDLPVTSLVWDPVQGPPPRSLEEFDAVINLMGESVASGRWTPARRQVLRDSRIKATQSLMAALAQRRRPLEVLISASAIGYYPLEREEALAESSSAGTHFLAELCQEWEAAALLPAEIKRRVLLRIGVVIGANGGALPEMIKGFEFGAGGTIGGGKQVLSWIHRDDLVGIIQEALGNPAYVGPINCVAPHPVTQGELTSALASRYRRPAFLPVPGAALRLLMGEQASIALASQRIAAARLQALGYRFRYPTIDLALDEALNLVERAGKSYVCHRLSTVQRVPRPLAEVFSFFCDPYNLEKITPPLLGFKIQSVSTPVLGNGTLITYKLSLHGFPMKWVTELGAWEEGRKFVDNQLTGPYHIWHHTHEFFAVGNETVMTDVVRFRLPLGLLGDRAGIAFVLHDVRKIFAYRRQVIEATYGAPAASPSSSA